jgi:hypothetical protein
LVVTGPVRAPPALGRAAVAVVVVEVSTPSLVAMSTPSIVLVVVMAPVNAAPAKSAFRLASVVTKAVVATCVVLVSAVAVGAVGMPVRVALLALALVFTAVDILLNSSSNSVPLKVLRGLPVVKASLDAKLVAFV